jgi:membrane protein
MAWISGRPSTPETLCGTGLYNRFTMRLFWRRLTGAIRRTIPSCVGQTQAIAFNMFLALAPTVVFVLGLVAASQGLKTGLLEVVRPFRPMLPPGLFQLIADFLAEPSAHPWRLILIGLAGALLAGGQMMRLVIDGLRMIYGDRREIGYWSRTWRALLLVGIAIAPWFMTTLLLGFGREIRTRLTGQAALSRFLAFVGSGIYLLGTLVVVMAVLAVIYRIGRPGGGSWAGVFRGAALAAVLWWIFSWAFGVYMRSVHYEAIYGGLEVAFGLMVWMELTATAILLGAAYNAERVASA